MKILKEGITPKIQKEPSLEIPFNCYVCGCEFTADGTEYSYRAEKRLGGFKEYSCTCPTCGGTVLTLMGHDTAPSTREGGV